MLQAVLLAALAAPNQSGGTTGPVAPLQGEHWFELANRLEFDLRFDESIIARIEGLRLDDDEQERRELARQLQHVAGRVATIRPEAPVEYLPEPVQWSAGGGRIAIQGDRLRVHDAATGEALFTADGAGVKSSARLEISPDGRFVAQGDRPRSRAELTVYDVEADRLLVELDGDRELEDVGWSHDGKSFAALFENEESGDIVEVRSLPGCEVIRTFDPGDADLHQCELSHDGNWLAAGGYEATFVWSMTDGAPVSSVTADYGTRALSWHPSEARLALQPFDDGWSWIFDMTSGSWEAARGRVRHYGDHSIAFDAARDRWVQVSEAGISWFKSSQMGPEPVLLREADPTEYEGGNLYREVALAPDGSLAVYRSNGNVYTVWDMTTGRYLPSRIQYDDRSALVGFASGKHVCLVEPSGLVHVIDPRRSEDGQRLPEPSLPRSDNVPPWIGEGSRRGLYTRKTSEVSLHELDGASTTLPRFAGVVDSLVPSPTGDLLAGHDSYGRVVVWDPRDAEAKPRSIRRIPSLRSVAFLPDGERLVTSSHEVPIGLWDPETMELRETLDWVNPSRADAVAPFMDGRIPPPDRERPRSVTAARDDDDEEAVISASDSGHLLVDRADDRVLWFDASGATVDLSDLVEGGRDRADRWDDSSVVHMDRVLFERDATTYLIDPSAPRIITTFEGELSGVAAGAATIRSGSDVLLVRVEDGAEAGRFALDPDLQAVAPVGPTQVAMLRTMKELRAIDIAEGGEGLPIAIPSSDIAGVIVLPDEVAAVELDSGELMRVDLATGETSLASDAFIERAESSHWPLGWGKWLEPDPVEFDELPPAARVEILRDPALGKPSRVSRDGVAVFPYHRFARVGQDGLTPIGARRRPVGSWGLNDWWGSRGFFGDGLYLTQWTQTESGFAPIVLEVGPSSMPPAEGDPGELMKEWSQRLSLRVTAEGRIEPITYEPR